MLAGKESRTLSGEVMNRKSTCGRWVRLETTKPIQEQIEVPKLGW